MGKSKDFSTHFKIISPKTTTTTTQSKCQNNNRITKINNKNNKRIDKSLEIQLPLVDSKIFLTEHSVIKNAAVKLCYL